MSKITFAAVLFLVTSVAADDWRKLMWEKPVSLCEGVTLRAYALDEPRLMKVFVARINIAMPGVGFTAVALLHLLCMTGIPVAPKWSIATQTAMSARSPSISG